MSDSADGLLQRLEALLGRIPAVQDEGGKGPVAYERFFEVNQSRKAAVEGLEALRAEVATLKQSHAAELEALKVEAAKGVASLQARHGRDLELRDLGLDGDGRAEVTRQWERLPEQGRPESPAAMWSGLIEAHQAHLADPEKEAPQVPRTLSAYLPQPEVQQQAAPVLGGGQRGGGVVVNRSNVDRGAHRGTRPTAAATATDAATRGDAKTFWETLATQGR